MSAVVLRRFGLQIEGSPLWLDARRKTPLSFVSHAHADHIARHDRVIATAATLRFMTHRLGKLSAPLPAPYGRSFELGPLVLELLPAGHVLGSAQLRVTLASGERVVYTGDLNLEPALTAEPAQVAECDTLVLESTFGHPRFRFPPKAEVLGALEGWIRAALEDGASPVLLGYPLGKSQEAMAHLSSRGLRLCAHSQIHELTVLYGELGRPIPNVRRFDGKLLPGEVAVFPPRLARSGAVRKLPSPRVAVLTGWALDPGAAARCGADVAFPLSDHADAEALARYAQATGASEVLTVHGFTRELAELLCARGISARPVGKPRQLELFAGSPPIKATG